jgi:N-acetylmuramic acid 6-phosphate etherase
VTFTKTTEQSSKIRTFRKNVSSKLLSNINQEDKTVPFAVEKALPQINW